MNQGTESRITSLLAAANREGGFPGSIVCTTEGLLIAASGGLETEHLAAVTSLFDDICGRAARDLGLRDLDELTIRAPIRGRYVVRPLAFGGRHRAFVVIRVPPSRPWRRVTNALVARIAAILAPLMREVA